MSHRGIVNVLRKCITSDEMLDLTIELIEHLHSISFDIKSSDFTSAVGYTFLASLSNLKIHHYHRLSKLMQHFYNNSLNINAVLCNYLQAFASNQIEDSQYSDVFDIIKILLPFCTNFFSDFNLWRGQIRLFRLLNPRIEHVINHLLKNYGYQKNYEILGEPFMEVFSLQHLSRNVIRDNVMRNLGTEKEFVDNILLLENVPKCLKQYLRFQETSDIFL